MKTSIRDAASHLMATLDAPRGAVNAMLTSDKVGPLIRLLVAPDWRDRVSKIPRTIDGFRVKVETRGTVTPQ